MNEESKVGMIQEFEHRGVLEPCANSRCVMFEGHLLKGFILRMEFTDLANQGFLLKTIRHLKRNNA
jgi:hypothetical protein